MTSLVGGAISSIRNAFIQALDYAGVSIKVLAVALVDGSGNLFGTSSNPLALLDAFQSTVATIWTSATAVNTNVSYPTAGYDTVVIEIDADAGITGGQIVFEVNSGKSWKLVKAANIANYATSSGPNLSGSLAAGFQVPVAGFPQFRARLANAITGAGNVTVSVTLSSAPDTSLVTVGMDPTQPLPAGANLIGGVNVDGVADNATTTNSVSSAAVVTTGAMAGYNGGSFQITSIGTGNTVVFEQSNDNATWQALYCENETFGVLGTYSGSAGAAGIYSFQTNAANVRARVSVYGSGTVTIYQALKRNAPGRNTAIAQGSAQIGSAAGSASATVGTGQTPARVTTNASGVIKASAGKLFGQGSIVNTNAAARYLQIYNKATAGVPGTDTPAMTIAVPASGSLPPALFTDTGIAFGTGISWAITTDFAGATVGASGDLLFTLNYI